MGPRILDQLKIKNETQQEILSIPYMIIGEDFSSLLMFDYLVNQCGKEKVKIFIQQGTQLEQWNIPAPSLVRGKSQYELLQKLLPEVKFEMFDVESKFYKNDSLRSFEGRMKPAKMIEGEDFFIDKKVDFKIENFLDKEKVKYLSSLTDNQIKSHLLSLEFDQENRKWKVYLSDGKIYICDYVFFGQGLKKFYQLLKNKNQFNEKFHQFFSDIKESFSLILHFAAPIEITDELGTVFIPQSQTHELGHFIGEFYPYEKELNEQKFSFMCSVGEHEQNPDEITKKVKLMKKAIGKVFPLFNKYPLLSETIIFTDKIPSSISGLDHSFEKVEKELVNFFFLGMESPLSKKFWQKLNLDSHEAQVDVSLNKDEISHLCRSFSSYISAKDIFAKDNVPKEFSVEDFSQQS